ncbi:sugar ABC transporter permease [Candidatus Gracilibacteria bacterium]|nr:sugar ABC transporter permease [Candidatus Gracilibacteria bacterium]
MSVQSVPTSTAAHASRQRRRQLRTTLAFWGFVGPLFLGLIVFTYIPVLWGFVLSFFEAKRTVTPTTFVGLENYLTLFRDRAFIQSLITVALFALFIVPATTALALGLALLVNSITRGQTFFRSVFFIPTACSYVVASLVWKLNIFNGLPFGLANMVLYQFGQDPIVWIGPPNPPWYWLVLVSVRLWLQVGFYMILFLAGLQEIPRSLYEAAYVDGASGGWTTFRNITFPLLRNTTAAVVVLNIIAAFQAFDEFINILSGTGSSNINLARPPLVYLYGIAIGSQDFGLGTAGAFILAAIIIGITLLQNRFFAFGREERA